VKKKKDRPASLRKEELQKQLKKKSSALERLKRESKIEAALEEVRSRSLAMLNSEELKDVISVVFEKLRELHVTMDSACILIFANDGKGYTTWAANPDLFSVTSVFTPYFDHPISNTIHNINRMISGKRFYILKAGVLPDQYLKTLQHYLSVIRKKNTRRMKRKL
jgi:hypothetical protein